MAKSARKYEYHHAAVPFDPLKYVKELENVGFTREQAEVQAETFFSIVQEQLVTKHDLKELENELKHNAQMLDNELKQNMKELENKLTQNIKELEAKTTLEFEAIRRDIETIRRDIKELEVELKQNNKELDTKITTQSELLRRDLKLWFGGMLVTLIVTLSTIQALIPHLTGH